MIKETNLNRYNFIGWLETYVEGYSAQDVEFAKLQVLKTKLGNGKFLCVDLVRTKIQASFEVIIKHEKVLEMKKAFLFAMEDVDAKKENDNNVIFETMAKFVGEIDMEQSLNHLVWLDERLTSIEESINELSIEGNVEPNYILKFTNESYMSLITEILTMFN